ncbi:MAG TPA: DUF4148 domain-containing protein [Rhizobacter sp.]
MNRKHALALALVIAAPASFAQATELELQHFGAPQASTTTRAAVRAEVVKARAQGENLTPHAADIAGVHQKAPAAGEVTRAQRRAEVLQARQDGTLDRRLEVDVNAAPVVSTRSRDDVRKEAVAATRNGAARGVQAGH